jgi:D-arabinose 1-dehydrogenase-like Zn-dependent alcohol dehydrogenase
MDEIILTGCRYANRQEIRESLDLVRRGLVKPAILQSFRLEEANRVHELIDNMKLSGRTVFLYD